MATFSPLGRRPYPRVRLRREFVEHVRAWMTTHRGIRGLCTAAFAGDDSPPKCTAVHDMLSRRALTNTLTHQVRFRALANATGWPADEPVDEQLDTDQQ